MTETKTSGRRTFHSKNCESCIRGWGKDKFGNRVTLYGQHAFGWGIIIEDSFLGNISYQYPNSSMAKKAFREYLKKR